MGSSSIEWTQKTWQVTAGCTRCSPGCANCYAERMAGRLAAMATADIKAGRNPGKKRVYLEVVNQKLGTGLDGYGPNSGWNRKLVTLEDRLTEPMAWKKPTSIFVDSESDLFHEDVPLDFIDRVFVVMALCPQHTFQVLTKRPERKAEYLHTLKRRMGGPQSWFDHVPKEHRELISTRQIAWPPPNIWLGTSVENQKTKTRIDELRKCPAAVRFLSLEPLLEDLGELDLTGISWTIVGGESGPGARRCNVQWIRSIIAQCKAAGVPCFVKQVGGNPTCTEGVDIEAHGTDGKPTGQIINCATRLGGIVNKKGGDWSEWPEDLKVREFPALPAIEVPQ